MGKIIIVIGILIVIIGLIIQFTHFNWNWLGKLPGDIRIEKPGFSFYFPITTSILVSVVISLLFWVLKKFHIL